MCIYIVFIYICKISFWLLLLANATSMISSYSTVTPHRSSSTRPSCYGPHLITYHCLTTPVPSNNMLGTRPSSRLIRLFCGHVSPTATIELDYWPSLRHTAATGCTPFTWLHVEHDSTTRQLVSQSGCAWKSTCVNLICVHVGGRQGGLSCNRSAGRSIRHHQLNDLI